MYKEKPIIAKEWDFVDSKKIENVDTEVPLHFPESDILQMNCPLNEKPLDIFDASWFWNMVVLEKEERENWLIVNVVYDENIDFKWFLNICNNHYKDLGYEYVAYHFKIEHRRKPNIWRWEYDSVMRMWATDDYMWTRCYVKYLNKKK